MFYAIMGDPFCMEPGVSQSQAQHDSMLLLTLREVSEIVSHSHDLHETLNNIVNLIQKRFATDVCTVYSVERGSGDLVLSATVGLRRESVNQVRMPIHEGLTGLVAELKAPVSVEDAPKHPRYRYFPESGEEQYHSFLGVPLIHAGIAQGVIVVQHREPRRYSPNEIRLLVGVAAQLAVLVTNAKLCSDLNEAVRTPKPNSFPDRRPALLHGIAASPGAARGNAILFEAFEFSNPALTSRKAESVEEERLRLSEALTRARDDIDRASRHLAELLGEQFGAIMQAQRIMLEDSTVLRDLGHLVDRGATVEQAIVHVCSRYLDAFQKLDNPFFYERIYDIKDVFRRVLLNVQASPHTAGIADVIIVASEVSLLELFASDLNRVRGILIEKGGSYSHVAILARSLNIPMLTQVDLALETISDGDEVFLDASSGAIVVNPDATRRNLCLKWIQPKCDIVETPSDSPLPMRLESTVNLLPEVHRTVKNGASAVGLYRSEILELARRSFPTEAEQLEVYRRMVNILDGRPLTIRTLDLRPDKVFGILAPSAVPAIDATWDWRLVHRLAHVQDLIRIQIRAVLQAATAGPIRLLFPMVVTQPQFECALRLWEEAKQSLQNEGVAFSCDVPVGVMVESPAAAMLAHLWIPRVSFVCIGSNDLLHGLLGLERENDRLAGLKTALEPTYLHTVRRVARQATRHGRSVTVCGEIANNPKVLLALWAVGVDGVSIPPDDLPAARQFLRCSTIPLEHRLAVGHELVSACDAEAVERIINRRFQLHDQ